MPRGVNQLLTSPVSAHHVWPEQRMYISELSGAIITTIPTLEGRLHQEGHLAKTNAEYVMQIWLIIR